VLPGDVIPHRHSRRGGFRRYPKLFLRDGDEILVEVEGIGCLTNQVQRAG
jgi:2-keto-4-pentenoate hydratase/2-oxohepta-3-ene-1,7-dioic acid hydratase in catechol pathway